MRLFVSNTLATHVSKDLSRDEWSMLVEVRLFGQITVTMNLGAHGGCQTGEGGGC